jgi:hypothetical protein
MTDARLVQRVSAPEPVQPTHLATKNYVDQALAVQGEDAARFGDLLSSVRRDRIANQTGLANGYWTFSSVIGTRAFSATKVRFYVATAGVAGAGPALSLTVYDNGTQVATAPILSTAFTSSGVKEFTLSSTVPVVAAHRYTVLLYIAAGSYAPAPSIGCTAAYYMDLNSPSATLTFNGYKTASNAPPSTITTGDGTWTALPATLWWAFL